jgi:signal transduction histidine kinase
MAVLPIDIFRPLAIRSGGLDIGLSVARDLVEAHGGATVAHNTGKNQGSEFIVIVPIAR